jgi:putative thiamine transport system substrate-binding protein
MKHPYRIFCSFIAISVIMLASQLVNAASVDDKWEDVIAEARGQTVYFNAWGGSDRINAYLDWIGKDLQSKYGVTLKHVKIGDIAEVVGQLEAAKAVGRDTDGNVDLMWVNGENFAQLKRKNLLFGSFAQTLPNAANVKQSPSITHDFSVPVEGLESPWGGAQLVFIYDSAITDKPPQSAQELLSFVKEGGRFSYPAPPAFHGTTMIKQILSEVTGDPTALANPVSEADFDKVTAPLWEYLDELNPLLWGRGKSWSTSGEHTRQLLDDGEVDIAISFNPNEATAAVKSGQLADTVRTYAFSEGTIGNTHFVTIPYNAKAAAAAMVVANHLISTEAQARKADPEFWGDPTVLDVAALPADQQAKFNDIDLGPWALPIDGAKTLSEPHASWAQALEAAWVARYSQ